MSDDAAITYAEDLILAAVEAHLKAANTAAGDRVYSDMDRALSPTESPAIAITWEDMVPSYTDFGTGIGGREISEEHVLKIHTVVMAEPDRFEARSKALASQVRVALADASITDRLKMIDLRMHRRTKWREEGNTLVHGGYVHLYVLTVKTREDAPDTLI